MELWHYPALAGLGVVAGMLNVLAGGGSLLTMPVMILFGFSPALANGTNRVALVVQNAAAVGDFRRAGFSDWRLSLSLAMCTVPGAVLGAVLAIEIDPLWFKRLLALVMVGVLVVTLRSGRPSGTTGALTPTRQRLILAHLGMIGVGLYGGFLQAGVGFMLMALLRGMLRLDLVRVNMHKVFIVGLYMVPSLLVFAVQGEVRWLAGLALAVGTAAGALIATRLQIRRGEGPIRIVFAVAVIALAVKLVADSL